MDTGTTQYRTIEYRRRHGERAIYTVTYGAEAIWSSAAMRYARDGHSMPCVI